MGNPTGSRLTKLFMHTFTGKTPREEAGEQGELSGHFADRVRLQRHTSSAHIIASMVFGLLIAGASCLSGWRAMPCPMPMPRVAAKLWPHRSMTPKGLILARIVPPKDDYWGSKAQQNPDNTGPGGAWAPAKPLFSYLFAATSVITYLTWQLSDVDIVDHIVLSPVRLLNGSLLHFPHGPLTGWWSLGRILTTTFLPYDWLPGLACGALLVAAGPAAERVLGRGRFALIFLLAGAAKNVAFLGNAATWDWFPDLDVLAAISEVETYGTGAGIMGVAAAMLVVFLCNRRLLSQEDSWRWVRAALVVAVSAAAAEQFTMDSSYWAALAAGAVLGWAVGPRFEPMPAQQQERQQQQEERSGQRESEGQLQGRGAAPSLEGYPALGEPDGSVRGLGAVRDTTPGWQQGLSFFTTAVGLTGAAVVLEFICFLNVVRGVEWQLSEMAELEGDSWEQPWGRELEENQDQFYDQMPDGLERLLRRPDRQLKA